MLVGFRVVEASVPVVVLAEKPHPATWLADRPHDAVFRCKASQGGPNMTRMPIAFVRAAEHNADVLTIEGTTQAVAGGGLNRGNGALPAQEPVR